MPTTWLREPLAYVEASLRVAGENVRLEEQPGAREQEFLSVAFASALLLGVAVGGFFVLRYFGLWGEQDTAVFVEAITGLQEAGLLVYPGSYGHGYAYPVWASMLGSFTGVNVPNLLQVYTPLLGSLFLGLFGFAAFRRLLDSDRLGLLAAAVLFLVPELVFSISRGNHEKLTVALTLLALLAMLMSYMEMFREGRWHVFAGWVVVFYFTTYTLVTLNAFFGSSFIVAATLTLIFAVLALRFRPGSEVQLGPVVRRLALIVGVSWALVVLVMWYVYPQAGAILGVFNTALERLGTLFLSFTPESDPYAVATSDWASVSAYRMVSAFRWVLFIGSFLTWLVLLVRTLRRFEETPVSRLFLLALYGAFGLQLVVAVPVDLVNLAAGTNLQVRMYTYFSLLAAPVFAYGLARVALVLRPSRSGRLFKGAIGVLLSGFVVLSLLKATLDPSVSNRWLFYRQNEVQAIRFWDMRHEYNSLWVDVEGRLRYAYVMRYPQSRSSNSFDILDLDPASANALRSPVIAASAVAWQEPPPVLWLENRPYDNGEVQIFHRIPRTPFQR